MNLFLSFVCGILLIIVFLLINRKEYVKTNTYLIKSLILVLCIVTYIQGYRIGEKDGAIKQETKGIYQLQKNADQTVEWVRSK